MEKDCNKAVTTRFVWNGEQDVTLEENWWYQSNRFNNGNQQGSEAEEKAGCIVSLFGRLFSKKPALEIKRQKSIAPIAVEIEVQFIYYEKDRDKYITVKAKPSYDRYWEDQFVYSDNILAPSSLTYHEKNNSSSSIAYGSFIKHFDATYSWEDGFDNGIEKDSSSMNIISVKDVPNIEMMLHAIEMAAKGLEIRKEVEEMLAGLKPHIGKDGKGGLA